MANFKSVAIALIAGFALLVGSGAGNAEARALTTQNDPQLENSISDYVSGLGAVYGVAAINLNDGSSVLVNADSSFPTASMYKLLVMYRVFEAIDQGALSMGDTVTITSDDAAQEDSVGLTAGDTLTVADALSNMIAVSSNASAWALARAVGGWGVVASVADELGMSSTGMYGTDFSSTPSDMAHFFRLLANRDLVSPGASEQMLDLLLLQGSNDRIPASLPGGAQVAHKTGELDGVRNDGGIVRGPGSRYVIVVMSQYGDESEEVAAEAEISRMIYSWYGD